MVCEHESIQIRDLLATYGVKGLVDAIATETETLMGHAYQHGLTTAAAAWGHDTRALRRLVPRLLVGGKGKS